MNQVEMIAILAKSSGGTRTESQIAGMLETPDLEEEKLCVCGDLLDNGGEHYDHMSNGY